MAFGYNYLETMDQVKDIPSHILKLLAEGKGRKVRIESQVTSDGSTDPVFLTVPSGQIFFMTSLHITHDHDQNANCGFADPSDGATYSTGDIRATYMVLASSGSNGIQHFNIPPYFKYAVVADGSATANGAHSWHSIEGILLDAP
jgi:hypothetical protein